MDQKALIVLLARQRSGTNAFRAVMNSHARIHCFGEVLSYDERDRAQPYSFIAHLHNSCTREQQRPENHLRLFSSFVDRLHSLHEKPLTLIDLKYNSCHHVSAPWQYLNEVPLFNWLNEQEVPVIRVRRSNYLRVYLSEEVARVRQKWNAHRSDELKSEQVSLPEDNDDMPLLVSRLRQWKTEDQIVSDAFAGHSRLIELDYEEMFPQLNEPISDSALERVSQFLNVANQYDMETWCRKLTARPLWDSIANWSQVCKALRGTEFEYCLGDEAMYHSQNPPMADGKKVRLFNAGALLESIRKRAG